ncbi:carboxylesterase [Thalassococcus profundi]|uniref:Carboxylesterase n=1 Tax=Thalassococcus profundi TaxID=2282382 RepID=A0A369TNL7_9RHOB|nr:holin family protein [Thalassococcus profundi]RDD66863.1 carboxylesterase [Thalassococcus profundi]
MGLIERILGLVFGSGRNVVAETAEVFRVNAEAQAGREAGLQGQALEQFGQEFRLARRGWFDRLMDALNRVPRPAMALGTLGLFVAAMVDPVWFAARMAGIALVPEPLWWLLGAIVSFYFGARHQAKGQDFQRDLAVTMAAVPQVVRTVTDIEDLRSAPDASPTSSDNPALEEWRAARAHG